jgi:hypothetical protein
VLPNIPAFVIVEFPVAIPTYVRVSVAPNKSILLAGFLAFNSVACFSSEVSVIP